MLTPIRRAFIVEDEVRVETRPGEIWGLQNPTPEGRRYEPERLLVRISAEPRVNLERWLRR